ncbi:hypothetical protein NDU88_003687 [Pleurodeles waltl]|uniref:Uncharacterized protein n=1 Tax=Pleurodeles waltl TaxID=8319 RepID=A0AAV7T5N7_PLEWA|nr:hypothetical protein NDU88_003687 [Pleurodeles waltl]
MTNATSHRKRKERMCHQVARHLAMKELEKERQEECVTRPVTLKRMTSPITRRRGQGTMPHCKVELKKERRERCVNRPVTLKNLMTTNAKEK